MKFTSTHFFIALIVLAIVGIGLARYYSTSSPAAGQYDAFAKCISNSGATFYGAFWCPHCQEQKKLFGSSVQYLPYHECSTPDGQGQLQDCTETGITGYPTWILKDGTRLSGVQTLNALATATNCPLPGA